MRSIGSLTLDMNCADRAQPYPTPFPTAPNHTTPYNPLQPLPTTTEHYATPILPTLPTVQYNPAPSSERPLFWKMSPFYPMLCLLRIFTEVSAPSFFLFFPCPGNMPPLVLFFIIKKNFDHLHRLHLWGLSASHLARCPPLVARDVNPWATLLSITVLTIFIILTTTFWSITSPPPSPHHPPF